MKRPKGEHEQKKKMLSNQPSIRLRLERRYEKCAVLTHGSMKRLTFRNEVGSSNDIRDGIVEYADRIQLRVQIGNFFVVPAFDLASPDEIETKST